MRNYSEAVSILCIIMLKRIVSHIPVYAIWRNDVCKTQTKWLKIYSDFQIWKCDQFDSDIIFKKLQILFKIK